MANPIKLGSKLSASEEAELEAQMKVEELAKAAVAAATDSHGEMKMAAVAAATSRTSSAPPATPKVTAGDIPVTCLKSEPFVSLGKRRYVLTKGAEVMMDPCHAEELSQSGWVAPVCVITSV